ncbi:GNAT family N-acetyltransferase [Streptomyces sp. DSM 44915]|uniref:GNAT family N-acetyltransferase n=1 Tax=Streptomyces chisholmiae TaxID=3075540 RepID=A0ABU2JNC1_9ACTN|nr:GNAT family N-acetyltransferase [Streptomyces sp. DSM 44915]MDT0266392.1 GNAT family N-acetyltransferase [Streptomyces sp. DSM 44915]
MAETRVNVELLADRPEFVEPLAALRFREWGPEPGRERLADYVTVTAGEAGREGLPVTWVASARAALVGGVGLAARDLPQRRDRGPWIVGAVVAADHRRSGVGRLLLAQLERHAAHLAAARVYVATGGDAVAFYQACGWAVDERVPTGPDEHATVLSKAL